MDRPTANVASAAPAEAPATGPGSANIRPPRLWTRRRRPARHATWLELFFDLVFVAIVGELAHTLTDDIAWSSVLSFAALFAPSGGRGSVPPFSPTASTPTTPSSAP